LSKKTCPLCEGELIEGIVISSSSVWTDARARFVPARSLNDRSLFGSYRKELATAARACTQCGNVSLFVNPGTLNDMIEEDG